MTITTARDPFAAQKALVETLDKSGWNLIVGDAFVRGMRDIGYKSTSYAMAELIDNSVQANATWVDVVFGFSKGGAKPTKIAVIDNGWGMVPAMARASLVWGAGTRPDDRQGFGKYGYGLPSASVSQCLRVEVYSKIKDGPWAKSYLDVEEIGQGKWTSNHKINTPEFVLEEPPAFVVDHLKATGNRWPMQHGTVVVWDKLDGSRLDYKTRDALRDSLVGNLGIIYRNYLVDVPMIVDGVQVEPCDPLFLTRGFRYYDLDEDRAVELPGTVIEVPDPATKAVKGTMRVRFSRLPASFYRKTEHKGTTASGKGVFNERAAIADAHQGIIFLRNGRQIDVVKPRNLGAFSNPTTDRYWKIEVDFDATLDDEFAMTTAKQQVIPSESVWDRLNDRAKLAENIATMRATYKKETAEIRGGADKKKKASIAALENAQKFKTTKPPKDTPARREEAEKNLEEEARRRAKESGVSEKTVKDDLIARQVGKERAVETEDLPGAPFFRCLQRGGQRVLLINKEHPFYTDVYAGPGSTLVLRTTLELLLWTLGDAEVDAEPESERRAFYEAERQQVWSPNLKNALNALRTIDLSDDEDEDRNAA